MRATRKRRSTRAGAVAVLTGSLLAVAVMGCGGGDFKNKPRPPVQVELTGVIQTDKVTVSPNRVPSPGPVAITISNQTKDAHTVTLEGTRVKERVGPINPLDTATIQKTLSPGTYEVRAGSSVAVPREIAPSELRVGSKRRSSNNRVLLP
jgi:hypothetical protein